MSQRASLAGSEAIVTGGSSGIGKAIAVRLVTAGANVTIAARREAVLAEAAQEIERRAGQICGPLLRGPAVRTAVVDVASKAAVEELAGIILAARSRTALKGEQLTKILGTFE